VSGDFFEVQGLVKRFGGLVAVNDVSFRMRREEVVGIIGPNGAGKTTLLRLITASSAPTPAASSGRDATSPPAALGVVNQASPDLPEHPPLRASPSSPTSWCRASRGAGATGEWVKVVEAKAMDALEFVGISDLAREPPPLSPRAT